MTMLKVGISSYEETKACTMPSQAVSVASQPRHVERGERAVSRQR
jgi:hypothetical protein